MPVTVSPLMGADLKRASIRFRVTALAIIIVTAVLLVASVVLVTLQRRSLTRSLDQTLVQRADDIASLLTEGPPPPQFSAGTDEGFVQLIAADGRVVASTLNLDGLPAIDAPRSGPGDVIQNLSGLGFDNDVFRVISRPVAGRTLLVGTTYEVVSESAGSLIGGLAITIPGLVALLGWMIWWLAGRTLRPVESIRVEVDRIEASGLHRRVPVPGTEDEVARLAATMNQMLGRLEGAVERQRRFVADASHEMRSPLTRLRAELEIGLSEESGATERARLRSLLDDVEAMHEMIDDLLYLARSDEGRQPNRSIPIDFDEVVLGEGRRAAARGRVDVDLSGVSGAHVSGDRSQLARAVKNLLDNAERHARSRIWISLTERDGDAVLLIGDDGPGIPAINADEIFERFTRLDEARETTAGNTGLGLAIVREIVGRHQGSVRVTNPGEPGATFEVRLPAAP